MNEFPSLMTPEEQKLIEDFHAIYYLSKSYGIESWGNTYWAGIPVLKCPLDLWLYQEIIYSVKPDLVIETGTAHGGSALYLANLLDLCGRGRVITVDLSSKSEGIWPRPNHSKIEYVTGDSVSDEVLNKIKIAAKGKETLVILDSDHNKDHVIKELKLYGPLVSKDSYIIVEDTNINGHPVGINFGPGPYEAVVEFLQNNKDFAVDLSMGKFFMSFNNCGYLRRIR